MRRKVKLGGRGEFHYRHLDRDGNLLREGMIPNLVTVQGLSLMLRAWIDNNSSLLVDNRFGGLIDDASFTATDHADTAASHGGWTENTAYTSATRPVPTSLVEDFALGTVELSFSFTMNAGSQTIRGFGVWSGNVKGGTTGFLWAATALLDAPDGPGPLTPNNGDTITYTYTFTMVKP